MRIACIHVPQFALQCATRLDPSLRGAPIAIVSAGSGRGPLRAPIVTACSRAAWAAGVRLGMTAPSARARAPELVVVPIEAGLERETVRALADALLGLAPIVDLGGRVGAGQAHLAMYAEVPLKTRGNAFGDKVVAMCEELGITARVGIADDRFTAWVAASHHDANEAAVTVVPRGGSAAFLAPQPLSLLAISPEVQHMLEALGVTTLGAFAGLPAPSVARPLEADYQALARGEGGANLRPYSPDGAIREDIVVTGNVLDGAATRHGASGAELWLGGGGLGGPGAIALVARRIALRLVGRDRLAAGLEVTAGDREHPIELARALASPEELARELAPALEQTPAGAWRLRVVVAREAIAGERDDGGFEELVPPPAPTIDPVAVVLSSSASLFTLAPQDARSERHRRTRRGKHRRARPTPGAQPRLFDTTSE
jgi:protein ImuB